MMKTKMLFLLFFFASIMLYSQDVKKIGESDIRSMILDPADKIHVINFWATWCGPCVVELPYFEKVASEFPADKVEFTLASLDFPSQMERRLIPFIKKHKLSIPVVLIEELDYDKWMRDVDNQWQGNIPATLIYNNAKNKRVFVSKPLDDAELREIINSML